RDAKKVAETTLAKEGTHHYTLSTPVVSREEKNIEQVITTIHNFTNPFIERNNGLFHVVTKVVMPSKVKKDLLEKTLSTTKDFGWEWKDDDNAWIPVMTTILTAPEAIIHLVKCKCVKERCTTKRCQCSKANMNYMDLCGFSDMGERCEKIPKDDNYEEDDSGDYDKNADEAEYEYVTDSDGEKLVKNEKMRDESFDFSDIDVVYAW
ncbi:unnamed protein product, partial [Porites lobata]